MPEPVTEEQAYWMSMVSRVAALELRVLALERRLSALTAAGDTGSPEA